MRTFDIEVWWDGAAVPGVSAMTPVSSSTAVLTVYDGLTGASYKVPGRSDTTEVTLSRGVTEDLAFQVWATAPVVRKDVEVRLHDPSDGLEVTLRLRRCWVCGYAVAPDLESGAVLESVTLAFDRWERVTPTVGDLARRLADRRGVELFTVPVGQLVTPYLEETQKHVDRLLDTAEESGAVLLLDEADALFVRRTEIEDAHDRYADASVGYLLDRLSRHTGPVFVVPPDPDAPGT